MEMTQGIAFKRLKDTVISGNEWKVVLDFDMLEVSKELTLLKSMCLEVVTQANTSVNVWNEDFEYEYNRIKVSIDQYEADLADLMTLLPNKRVKRGLINAGGFVLKWLFGTPTSEDLEHVNVKVEELKLVSGNLVHSRENQLTVLKEMNSKMLTNTRAIKEIMDKLSQANGHLSISLTGYNEENIMLHRSLTKHLQFTSMLRHLGQSTDEAKLRIVEFRQALELINSGKISSKLLPPHEFVNTLSHVEKMLPTHLKLVIPVNIEDIFLYYSLCSVQAIATKNGIRLVITVPLGSTDRQYDTYKIETIPLYNENLQHWIKWNIESDYLLISKDRQYFTSIRKQTLDECRNSHYYLCPNSIVVYHHTVGDCPFSLFISSEHVPTKCSRVLTENVTSPFWVQNGNDWIYSLKEPYKIVMNCLNDVDDSVETMPRIDHLELTLNRSGILKQMSKCDIFGKETRIFSRIQGNVMYKFNLTQLHIPKINLLMPQEETFINESKSTMFKTLKSIKENLNDNHVNVELEKLFQEQYLVKENPSMNFVIDYSYVIILVLGMCFISILSVVVLCRRRILICCRKPEPEQSQPRTIRVEEGTPLAEILQETSFVKFATPDPHNSVPGTS